MNAAAMKSVLTIGETIAVEFKRCGNGIGNDVYETVCSFLNRFGGDLFLGVMDDGTVSGIPEKAAPDVVRNFISCISNPALFSPTVYLAPEIVDYEGKTVIHIHVPPSAEVHSYKKVIYDRIDDADIRVTATTQIAQMYIRKQNIYTEQKVYPYVGMEDLRLDLLPKLRVMAANNSSGKGHPWSEMSDEELLHSARLYGTDRATGAKGYNLAAVMLLGKDDVILDVAPAYVTDALLRRVNVDRYDDREVVKTNLIESYEQLMEFGRKHLLDKFFLENDLRKSLRYIICREMIGNTLIHREFTSSYQAKFVIERERMYVENANRALRDAVITPENLEPNPKNPIVAAFFRNIGYADQLGSGVRNLYKYGKYYSGEEPQFVEGDVFRIVVPLNDGYSYELKNLDTLDGTLVREESVFYGKKAGVVSKKQALDTRKTGVVSKKQALDAKKTGVVSETVDFSTYLDHLDLSGPTRSKIKLLYRKFGQEMVFSRADVMKITGLSPSPAGSLIRKMREIGCIEPVRGQGKGKYHFSSGFFIL